jgi:outer membrane murein-binding lipoprotein Lpp
MSAYLLTEIADALDNAGMDAYASRLRSENVTVRFLRAERDRLREDAEAARWTIDKVRERIAAAAQGDLTALFEEVDRLCLSFQQMHPPDAIAPGGIKPAGPTDRARGESIDAKAFQARPPDAKEPS